MKETHKYLTVCGLLALLPCFCPKWHPLLVVPLVVATYHRASFVNALWASLGCGALFDFLSADGRLGTYALAYFLATLTLYPQKQVFYASRITTLPLLTALFTSLATLFAALFLRLIGKGFAFWWGWALTDLLALPLLDGLYCLIGVALPLYLLFGRAAKPVPYKMERPK